MLSEDKNKKSRDVGLCIIDGKGNVLSVAHLT